jgi:hypothetical protein
MGLRSATTLAIVCTTLALVLRLGAFTEQLLRWLPNMENGMTYFMITTGVYCLGDVLVCGSLLIFFLAVRRSLPADE